jgi:HD-GYP domain-containing protein (c-di-GMP phosphodiesterase class II)
MHQPAIHPEVECVLKADVRIPEVISGLSYALDLAEGQPEGHAVRTCLIGMRVADELRVEEADRSALLYTLLLKDLGGTGNASKICYLFGADDRRVKSHLRNVDWANISESVRFMRCNVMPDGAPLQRVLRAVVIALEGAGGPRKFIRMRSEQGVDFARRLGFSEATATPIGQVDERWDGRGQPEGLKGEEISLFGRIAGLAQAIEMAFTDGGTAAAIQVARERRGTWFDPSLVDAFLAMSGDSDFWDRVGSSDLRTEFGRFEPARQLMSADEATLDRIARVFADVVDGKSPWTFRHSTGVAEIAVGIGNALGLSRRSLSRIHRAGLLHDVGKLGVSNLILDKPGNLTSEEYVELRRHPQFTLRILERIPAFRDIAEMAATHHERLDGRGYHRGIPAGKLPIESRLLVVADICEALSARRPYRDALPREKVHEILTRDAGTAVCPQCVEALKAYHDQADQVNRVNVQLEELDRVLHSG